MYTRLPCRNTASLIFLFIVSVISIQGHNSFTFVVSVDGTMGRDGSAILLTDSLTRVRSSLGSETALCSDCLPSSWIHPGN